MRGEGVRDAGADKAAYQPIIVRARSAMGLIGQRCPADGRVNGDNLIKIEIAEYFQQRHAATEIQRPPFEQWNLEVRPKPETAYLGVKFAMASDRRCASKRFSG